MNVWELAIKYRLAQPDFADHPQEVLESRPGSRLPELPVDRGHGRNDRNICQCIIATLSIGCWWRKRLPIRAASTPRIAASRLTANS